MKNIAKSEVLTLKEQVEYSAGRSSAERWRKIPLLALRFLLLIKSRR